MDTGEHIDSALIFGSVDVSLNMFAAMLYVYSYLSGAGGSFILKRYRRALTWHALDHVGGGGAPFPCERVRRLTLSSLLLVTPNFRLIFVY